MDLGQIIFDMQTSIKWIFEPNKSSIQQKFIFLFGLTILRRLCISTSRVWNWSEKWGKPDRGRGMWGLPPRNFSNIYALIWHQSVFPNRNVAGWKRVGIPLNISEKFWRMERWLKTKNISRPFERALQRSMIHNFWKMRKTLLYKPTENLGVDVHNVPPQWFLWGDTSLCVSLIDAHVPHVLKMWLRIVKRDSMASATIVTSFRAKFIVPMNDDPRKTILKHVLNVPPSQCT